MCDVPDCDCAANLDNYFMASYEVQWIIWDHFVSGGNRYVVVGLKSLSWETVWTLSVNAGHSLHESYWGLNEFEYIWKIWRGFEQIGGNLVLTSGLVHSCRTCHIEPYPELYRNVLSPTRCGALGMEDQRKAESLNFSRGCKLVNFVGYYILGCF